MRQIFVNLANNAVRAAPPDTVITWCVAADPRDNQVLIAIHNLGEPIPPPLLFRLTEPLFSTRPDGTGLGLAIVQRLVEQQGGTLVILSTAETGIRVELAFPKLEDQAATRLNRYPPRVTWPIDIFRRLVRYGRSLHRQTDADPALFQARLVFPFPHLHLNLLVALMIRRTRMLEPLCTTSEPGVSQAFEVTRQQPQTPSGRTTGGGRP